MELNGEVGSGLNRAHKFMAQPHYQEQFEEILGYSAWPGTLNVKVDASDLGHYVALREASGIDTLNLPEHIRSQAGTTDVSELEYHRIRPFLRDGKSFGGATVFPARIAHIQTPDQHVECAILVPDLTSHVDVIEVISPKRLRGEFSLSDGDRVSVITRKL